MLACFLLLFSFLFIYIFPLNYRLSLAKSYNENRRDRVNIDTPNSGIHVVSISWIGTGTSIKRAKLVYGVQSSSFSEMMRTSVSTCEQKKNADTRIYLSQEFCCHNLKLNM